MTWISLTAADQEDIRKTLSELENDSDRAAGIVGAVLVEESLKGLLQSRLLPEQELIGDLFRASGPLGAFSVKINVGFLMGLYSLTARKELNTIRQIRNHFAHRIALSFFASPVRDLANNLSLSETIEFHMAVREDGQSVLYIGTKPPPEQQAQSVPILPPITPDKLTHRERYLRACQFYSGALLFTMHAMPKSAQPVYF
jgi:hypothetical protein